MYEDLVARRNSRWWSIEGNLFETTRYIKVIFYVFNDVKDNKPYYSYGAYGAVVGGGTTNKHEAIDFVNRHLAKGESSLTEAELDKNVEGFRKKILAKEEMPVVYFRSFDDEVVYCPFCHHEHEVKPHANYIVTCEYCKRMYRIASI
jgi:hypothetical protein